MKKHITLVTFKTELRNKIYFSFFLIWNSFHGFVTCHDRRSKQFLIFIHHHHEQNNIFKSYEKRFFVALCCRREIENIISFCAYQSEDFPIEKKWNENRYENEHMSNDIVLIPFPPSLSSARRKISFSFADGRTFPVKRFYWRNSQKAFFYLNMCIIIINNKSNLMALERSVWVPWMARDKGQTFPRKLFSTILKCLLWRVFGLWINGEKIFCRSVLIIKLHILWLIMIIN